MKSFDQTWEDIHASQEWGKYPSEPVIRFVARNYYISERKNVKILDFGCGGGNHTWYLAREGFDTYAFDGSPSAIKRVKTRLEKEGLTANLKVCDALELDYETGMFDCVVDSAAIYANTYENIAHFFEEEELRDLLTKAGFKNVIIDTLRFTDRGGVVEQYLVQAEK